MPGFARSSVGIPAASRGTNGTTCCNTGARRANSSLRSRIRELMVTMPAMSCSPEPARSSAIDPPIECPTTTTRSQPRASVDMAVTTLVRQSEYRVRERSRALVPCPGRRGTSTLYPAAARRNPSGRVPIGFAVNPCTTTTPCAPRSPCPRAENGSAPGTATLASTWLPPRGRRLRAGPSRSLGNRSATRTLNGRRATHC